MELSQIRAVFDAVAFYMRHGLTQEEAIREVESLTHSKLPNDLKDRIRSEKCQT